jgi:hypothetical protein
MAVVVGASDVFVLLFYTVLQLMDVGLIFLCEDQYHTTFCQTSNREQKEPNILWKLNLCKKFFL